MNMRHLEHSGVIQAKTEGLTLQQIVLRDELQQQYGLSYADANAVILGEKKASEFGITAAKFQAK